MRVPGRAHAVAFLVAALCFGLWQAPRASAEPPSVDAAFVEGVTATSADLHGQVDPNGTETFFRFEYLTEAAYLANLEANPPREAFSGASFAPSTDGAFAGTGTISVPVGAQNLANLIPETAYRYRLRAENTSGEVAFGVARPFGTEPPTNSFALLDGRGWEMVSPPNKGGGAVQPPGQVSGGGVFQAAAAGGAFSFSSADSFGAGAQGAPAGSQYVATRGPGGWSSSNITAPLLSGSYGDEPDGVPYQLFSSDLSAALLSNGERCRGDAGDECPVANPPLPDSGAPAGYRDYYLRTSSGAFVSLLSAADLTHTGLGPEQFELRLVGATPDLAHVLLSSCAALTPEATEVPAPGGCDQTAQNLYEWSGGSLRLINLLPGDTFGTPGAALAAPGGAISADGTRVYFRDGGTVYLREDAVTRTVLESAAPSAFQAASSDGGVAYLVAPNELDRYEAATATLTSLTAVGIEGILGTSADGSAVYYAQSGGIFLRRRSAVTEVAAAAAASNWPATTGTARVSPDGSHLVFLSTAELTGFQNEGQVEVFLYGQTSDGLTLTCVSCDPTGEKPDGPGAIPEAIANGSGAQALQVYKPRVMSTAGDRVFFESADQMVPHDTNSATDVYEWEADGSGTCPRVGGCVQLISNGKGPEASHFLDADAAGDEAFFLTAESLYPLDPGSPDVYDARVGGGFAIPETTIPCIGDACQILPPAPEDPAPGTLVPNAGNPPLKIAGEKTATEKKGRHHRKKKHRKHRRKSKGVRKHRSRGSR